MISTDPRRCSSAFAHSPRLANTRPRFARACDRATGSPIVLAKARARSALEAASSIASKRRRLSTAFASAYAAKRISPVARAMSADRAKVAAASRASPSLLMTMPRLIWIAASSLVALRTVAAASRRRALAPAMSPRAIRTAPRSVKVRTRSREPLEHLRRPDEVADRGFKVPEFPLDAPEGPQGLAFDFRRVQA